MLSLSFFCRSASSPVFVMFSHLIYFCVFWCTLTDINMRQYILHVMMNVTVIEKWLILKMLLKVS